MMYLITSSSVLQFDYISGSKKQ